MSKNQAAIYDESIRHQVDLIQHSNGIVNRIISNLNAADALIFQKLQDEMDRLERTNKSDSWKRQHLSEKLESIRELNAKAMESIDSDMAAEMKKFSAYEVGYQLEMFASLPVAVSLSAVSAKQAYSAALARPFQGKTMSGWLNGIGEERARIVREALRVGYLAGETNEELIQKIRGTKKNNYVDGLMEISRVHAETIVRSATAHYAATARELIYEENADIIPMLRWIATLDSRTSEICRPRNLKLYRNNKSHTPVDHQFSWLRGPGKCHPRCRSVSVPVLEGDEDSPLDMQRSAKDYSKSSKGRGSVLDANTTYSEWLKRQPDYIQDQILGKTRGELFRSGGYKVEDFYNDKGKYLSIDQLRENDKKAFERLKL